VLLALKAVLHSPHRRACLSKESVQRLPVPFREGGFAVLLFAAGAWVAARVLLPADPVPAGVACGLLLALQAAMHCSKAGAT
jgi:hypothetical protein